uniref:ParB-like N-terminal domain-containing protein n=1 Tax=Thermosporothrix sp. COM3 TaxID=2490863 RepID=A0A455SIE9_9CHLR|nr:hypothetical protein KTC_14600 [Thermosporothrix sp. COM3]
MPKKGRPALDPLQQIAVSGFIGYVDDDEEVRAPSDPGVIWIEIDRIHDNPFQHAEEINPADFQSLVASIKADGFQGALNVSPLAEKEGHYFLTGGGHQRRDAAREAGLTKVPVFVEDPPPSRLKQAFRAARENGARVNTSPVNLGHLYQHIMDEFHMTQDQVAQMVHKDRNHVKLCLMAARSPEDIQEMLRRKPDSLRAMTYFRRLESKEDRAPIMQKFLAGELTTDGVRAAVEVVLTRQQQITAVAEASTHSPQTKPTPEAEVESKKEPEKPLTEKTVPASPEQHSLAAERIGKLHSVERRFHAYRKIAIHHLLTEEERVLLQNMAQAIQELLGEDSSTE